MELSAELFEETIAAIKGYGSSGKQSKRIQPRVGVRCRIKMHSVGAGAQTAPLEAWTRDFSRSGIGIVCSRRIKPGSRYCLTLARQDESPPLLLFCTVKNCSELAPGIFAVGMVFDATCDPAASSTQKPASAAPIAAPAPSAQSAAA